MTTTVIAALVMTPIILLPVAFVGYLTIGGTATEPSGEPAKSPRRQRPRHRDSETRREAKTEEK